MTTTTTTTTKTEIKGWARRDDAITYQARCIARGDTLTGTAPIVRVDGRWVLRLTLAWAAVATIPLPERQPSRVFLVGPRGQEVEVHS